MPKCVLSLREIGPRYIKEAEAQGKKMKGDVLFTLGETQGGPSIEKIVWYLLDRAVLMSTKRAA